MVKQEIVEVDAHIDLRKYAKKKSTIRAVVDGVLDVSYEYPVMTLIRRGELCSPTK